MNIKMTVGVPTPPIKTRSQPRPYTEVAENPADAAGRLNEYVKGGGSIMVGPKDGFTEQHVIRAIEKVEPLPSIEQHFKSGVRTRSITLEYTSAKPTPPPIDVYF